MSSILSPPLHQSPDASLPDGNSGAHQSRCDLVNVGENTTDTSHTHSLNSMTTLAHVQDEQAFEALTDEELESVNGGNATAVQEMFKRVAEYYTGMFRLN